MFSAAFLVGFFRARSTAPRTAFAYLRIGLIVGMALGAVSSSQHAFASVPPANVFEMSDRLQVSRVDAATNAAFVVKFKAFGNTSDKEEISGTMGLVNAFLGDPKATVPKMIEMPGPDPTSRFSDNLNVTHKAFLDGRERMLIVSHRASSLSTHSVRGKTHGY